MVFMRIWLIWGDKATLWISSIIRHREQHWWEINDKKAAAMLQWKGRHSLQRVTASLCKTKALPYLSCFIIMERNYSDLATLYFHLLWCSACKWKQICASISSESFVYMKCKIQRDKNTAHEISGSFLHVTAAHSRYHLLPGVFIVNN